MPNAFQIRSAAFNFSVLAQATSSCKRILLNGRERLGVVCVNPALAGLPFYSRISPVDPRGFARAAVFNLALRRHPRGGWSLSSIGAYSAASRRHFRAAASDWHQARCMVTARLSCLPVRIGCVLRADPVCARGQSRATLLHAGTHRGRTWASWAHPAVGRHRAPTWVVCHTHSSGPARPHWYAHTVASRAGLGVQRTSRNDSSFCAASCVNNASETTLHVCMRV